MQVDRFNNKRHRYVAHAFELFAAAAPAGENCLEMSRSHLSSIGHFGMHP